ncbi:hypothetical protein [Massilistercora timonensis]|uniref:hypothetical protein n=1 Tax=Massilistercora timonensis TaxID=2086584 RepID=UPI00320A6D60
MNGHQEKEAQTLFNELTSYERKGVGIILEGRPASPMQVVRAYMVREDADYMRDYVMDEKGDIRELYFHDVKEKKRL